MRYQSRFSKNDDSSLYDYKVESVLNTNRFSSLVDFFRKSHFDSQTLKSKKYKKQKDCNSAYFENVNSIIDNCENFPTD